MVCEARIVRLPITKMHGAGNDFVVLDARGVRLESLNEFARWACDRHRGVGADGLIALQSSRMANVRMRTLNSDGSEAEMCGNGARCAARWLDEAGEGDRIAFETASGTVHTEIVTREPKYLVRVVMKRPNAATPLRAHAGAFFVDLGNPHVVTLVRDLEDVALENLAMQLQKVPEFPDGTNVHVAMPLDAHTIAVRHWERGVGATLACGTGAVACACVAIEQNTVVAPVSVMVPGGELTVRLNEDGDVLLTGPAERVFDTELEFVP